MPGLGSAIPLLGGGENASSGSAPQTDTLNPVVRFEDIVTAIKRQTSAVTENLGLNDTQTILRGVVLYEQLALAVSALPTSVFNKSLVESLRITDAARIAIAQVVTEGLGLAITDDVKRGVAIIEQLGLLETVASAAIYNRAVSETLHFSDTLGRFFGADITESLGIGEALSSTLSFNQTIAEGLGLSATVTPNLVIRVTATEELQLTDVQALNAIYSGVIEEGLGFAIGYLAPDGSFTTWAMNTRSAAVTEYSNYVFNSFARFGDICVGASSDGLYELLGDDDAGTDIVAQIKSGFAQWAGSRFTMFKGVYLGVRGEGDWILKLETGDGNTYNYAVSTRNQRTTKVHLGKGLRARYWSFELISSGQDFDLDTIEFVPLVADRRV